MSKLTWNNFIKNNSAKVCFAAAVPATLPKPMRFDENGIKSPTPYGLFSEWLSKTMTGNWAVTKVTSGFYVAVAENQDSQLIAKKVGVTGHTAKSPISNQTHRLLYMENNGLSYPKLAAALGYKL